MSRPLSVTVLKTLRAIAAVPRSRSIDHSGLGLRELLVRRLVFEHARADGPVQVDVTAEGCELLSRLDQENSQHLETIPQEFHVEHTP